MAAQFHTNEPDDSLDPELERPSPDVDEQEPAAEGELNPVSDLLNEPFDPPADFDFGDEFEPGIPRPIPARLRSGSLGRRQFGTVMCLLAIGAGCILSAPIPMVKQMAFHVLPLAYLSYIGYGLLAIAGVVAIRNRFMNSRYKVVRDGIPIVGRVLQAGTVVQQVENKQTGIPDVWVRPAVDVQFRDPETGELKRLSSYSPEAFPIAKLPKLEVLLTPGEYTTLVAMPGQVETTLTPYGFLGLDPEREAIHIDGQPPRGLSPFGVLAIFSGVLLLLWMFVWFLYASQTFVPREWDWSLGGGFLAGGIVGMTVLFLLWRRQRIKPYPDVKHSPPSAYIVGGIFSGALLSMLVMCTLNSLFDRSESQYEPVHIDSTWSRTTNLVFRTYDVKFRHVGQQDSQKQGTTPDELALLNENKLAALVVRQGALGLEWVQGIRPVVWKAVPETETVPDDLTLLSVNVGEDEDQNPRELRLTPVLLLDEYGSTAPAPDELVPEAIQLLKSGIDSGQPAGIDIISPVAPK